MKFFHEKRLTLISQEIITEAAINSRNQHNSLYIDYAKFWQSLYKNQTLQKEIGLLNNFYQHNWPEQLLVLICRFYLINKLQFIPIIKWTSNEPLRSGVLNLNLHFGLSPLAYYANHYGAKYCVISDYPNSVKISFGLIGLYASSAKVIQRDQKIFLRILEALRSNHLVSCTTDFRDQVSDCFNSISPAIFRFIAKYNVESQSVAYRVLENGQIELVPKIFSGLNEKDLINEFLDNQYTTRPHLKFQIKEFNLNDQKLNINSHFNSF